MHEIVKYFFKRLEGRKQFRDVDWSTWNKNKISITTEFFPVEVKDNKCFIPTGTKDEPHGISTIHDCFILFYSNNKAIRYVYIEELKDFIRFNHNVLKRRLGEDKKYGYEVDYILLKEYHDHLIYKI